MKGKLFGLYSLENATYFGAKQYVYFGESLFFEKSPQWAKELKVFEAFQSADRQFDKTEKTFLSALGFLDYLSKRGIEMFFQNASSELSSDSSMVFDFPLWEVHQYLQALRLMGTHCMLKK